MVANGVLRALGRWCLPVTDASHAVGNPAPGTVIDTNIVSNAVQEWYLCCQHVNQVWWVGYLYHSRLAA